jgi:iron complex transport system permease protein
MCGTMSPRKPMGPASATAAAVITPHICRMAFGPDHRLGMIVTPLAGAIFLMVAETLCRSLGPALGLGRVPVGILTALAGGPFFIFLLRTRFRGAGA